MREKESLMKELKPYLELNDQIRAQADRQALLIQYGVLAYMCGLWGVLFRLTWWEYSWDIMEPITYFITYGLVRVYLTIIEPFNNCVVLRENETFIGGLNSGNFGIF